MNLKKYLIIFLFLIVTTDLAKAHENCSISEEILELSKTKQIPEDTPEDLLLAEEYRWLYEILIPETVRQSQPEESFKSFRVHLKDSDKTFPHPDLIIKSNLKNLTDGFLLEGKITYVGIVKKPYKMEVKKIKNGFQLNVRIHLQNPTAQDMIDFTDKVKNAERLWNESRLKTDFKYEFKFDIVDQAYTAHFSVRLLDETRGPYDQNWGRDWTARVVAHEIGHMLGLGDEYQTLSGKFDCLRFSLMCTAWSGDHLLHHHYYVLRRLIENKKLF